MSNDFFNDLLEVSIIKEAFIQNDTSLFSKVISKSGQKYILSLILSDAHSKGWGLELANYKLLDPEIILDYGLTTKSTWIKENLFKNENCTIEIKLKLLKKSFYLRKYSALYCVESQILDYLKNDDSILVQVNLMKNSDFTLKNWDYIEKQVNNKNERISKLAKELLELRDYPEELQSLIFSGMKDTSSYKIKSYDNE